MKISDVLRKQGQRGHHHQARRDGLRPARPAGRAPHRRGRREHGRLERRGIVSERDIVRHLHSTGTSVLEAPVSQIMTSEVTTGSADDNIADLAGTMTEMRVRHVPIVDARRQARRHRQHRRHRQAPALRAPVRARPAARLHHRTELGDQPAGSRTGRTRTLRGSQRQGSGRRRPVAYRRGMTAYDRTERVPTPRPGARTGGPPGQRARGRGPGSASSSGSARTASSRRSARAAWGSSTSPSTRAVAPSRSRCCAPTSRTTPTPASGSRREVDTLSRIRDARVASVIDADVMAPRPYIVTRYVPGPALDEVVEDHGPLAPADLLRLARGIAEAIRAIHACGVVHRDIKPGNVLIEDGDPVLIDFGIAHLQDDVRHTVGGLVMGTPGYLSPELVEGAAITDATDWWGWAATITYAASGRPPFGRARMDAVLTRVRAGDVDLDGVDPRLVPLLRASLSPDPRLRPHADEVIAALELYAAGRAATVPTPSGDPWDDGRSGATPGDTQVVAGRQHRVMPPVGTQVSSRRRGAALARRGGTRAVGPVPDRSAVADPGPRHTTTAGTTSPSRRRTTGAAHAGLRCPSTGAAARGRRAGPAGRLLARRRAGRGRRARSSARATRASACRCAPACSAPPGSPGSAPSWRGRASPSSCSSPVRARPRHRPVVHVARAAPLRLGRRRSDVPVAVVSSPWHLVVGVIATGVGLLLPVGRGARRRLRLGPAARRHAGAPMLGPGAPMTLVVGGVLGLPCVVGPGRRLAAARVALDCEAPRARRAWRRRSSEGCSPSSALVAGAVALATGASLTWNPFSGNPFGG